jgi:hypothetical protein
MTRSAVVLCLVLSVLQTLPASAAQRSRARASSSRSARVVNPACPVDGKAATLTAWREKQIAKLVGGESDGPDKVLADLKACFFNQVPKCMKGLESYAHEKNTRGGYPSGGTDEGSEGAFAANILKSEKDLPPEFLAKDASGRVIPGEVKIPENIMEIAKRKGWLTTTYKTRSTGGFDNAPNLFILVIPGERKDIVMQIQLPTGGDNYDPVVTLPAGHAVTGQNTLTTITVDKTVTPNVGQLQLHNKDYDGNNYKWSKNVRDGGDCISCHASPLRPISPVGYVNTTGREQPMTRQHQAEVDKINEVLARDRVVWGSYTSEGKEYHRGPPRDSQPLGFAPKDSPTRKEEFLRNCASGIGESTFSGFGAYEAALPAVDTSKIRWNKLAAAMNCTTCHGQGKVRGALTSHFSSSEIRFKVLVDRSMPEDEDDLNMDERLALVACLEAEREEPSVRDDWQQGGRWMKGVACTDSTLPEGPAGEH